VQVVRRDRESRCACRIEPPLQHVALEDERAGRLALVDALRVRPDVDEQGTLLYGVRRLVRVEPVERRACLRQQVVDGPTSLHRNGLDELRGHAATSGSSVTTVRPATSRPGSGCQKVMRCSPGA
jgi:hypothetical protein